MCIGQADISDLQTWDIKECSGGIKGGGKWGEEKIQSITELQKSEAMFSTHQPYTSIYATNSLYLQQQQQRLNKSQFTTSFKKARFLPQHSGGRGAEAGGF